MFSRVLGIPLLLGAAIGVPYVATNGPNLAPLWNFDSTKQTSNSPTSGPGEIPLGKPLASSLQGPGAVLYPIQTPLEGVKDISLHDVFRLDVSKEWVYGQWARKSTALAELGLYGVRVPLVTGTELHDLAGSLTYFFDSDGRVQRISFRGHTGDTTQLVMLAVQRYGLQRQPTAIVGEQLFQVRRKGQVFSELRTRPAAVLWADSPHESFQVNFELQRPDATTPLPLQLPPLPAVAQAAQAAATQANAAAQQGISEQAGSSEQETEKQESGPEKWRVFFPRSRIPQKQVESLDKRGRYW